MLGKSQTIKSNIDNVLRPVDFIHKYLKSNMSIIHKYMLIYEQSPSAVKFLLSIKKIKTKDVMDLLSDIQIKNGGYRSMRKEKMLKCLPDPKKYHSVRVTDLAICRHISCLNQTGSGSAMKSTISP